MYLFVYLFIYLFILPNVGFRESNYIKMFNHGGMTMNHTKYVVSEWGMPLSASPIQNMIHHEILG
jgi:hypothetical protein